EDVANEVARERIGAVPISVRTRVRSEYFSPVRSIVKAISVVERVTCLVTQVPHRFFGAFDRGRVVLLDPGEPCVREVKRHAYQRRSVRTSPLVAQVNRRAKLETLCGELLVELCHQLFEQGPANLQSDVRDPLRQERMTLAFPVRGSLFHDGRKGQAVYRVNVFSCS